MKKGIRGHDVEAAGLKNIAQKCREQGIEYLQLVFEKSIDGFQYGQYTKEYAESIKTDLGDRKIAVLGSYINPSDPNEETLSESIAKFKEKIRYASILNPIVVGTETGIYIEGKTHTEEAYQHLLKTVKELVREAEKYGVCVGIEGVYLFVINTAEAMARLVKDVDSDNIKVIFDPCNLITMENYKNQDKIISDMFDMLQDKIAVIHMKDFIVEDGNRKRVSPGQGIFNYELLFKKMREYNLDIPIISEEISDSEAVEAFENIKDLW